MSNTRLDDLLKEIINVEGGYVNDPVDRGGPTKYGVTLTTLQYYKPGSTLADLKDLTVDQAGEIYKDIYFYGAKTDKLPVEIQDIVFDMNVNHGVYYATKILQDSLNVFKLSVTIDGKIGPNTIKAAFAVNPHALRFIILEKREDFYQRIVARDASQKRFINGWLANRVDRFKDKG